MAPNGVNLSVNPTGQGGIALPKWQLLKAVEGSREALGLKGTTIAILRAALSFIRSDDISANRHESHVCFASNASLADRAHVSVQTVERHISKLVKLGLLMRVSSGNGKRWARRDGQGRIVFAAGLSVLPLHQRHGEFQSLAEAQSAKTIELRVLRDTCVAKLAELLEIGQNAQPVQTLKEKGRTLLRRRPNSETLTEFLSEITREIAQFQAPDSSSDTEELKGSDHHIEGHKETPLIQSVKKIAKPHADISLREMEQSFPTLCAELRFAPSQQACQRQMEDLAQHLGLGSLWASIIELGPALSFMVLGYILERSNHIQNPRGYAWRLLIDLQSGQVDWQTLLRKPQRPD